jgi:phage host-nuclease inhibitor protein Gam
LSEVISNIRQAVRRLNELLRELSANRREMLREQSEYQAAVQVLTDSYEPKRRMRTEREEQLVDEIVGVAAPRYGKLVRKGTQIIGLRYGLIKWSLNQPRIKIADGVSEDTIVRRIRLKRGLRKFTQVGKRTLKRGKLAQHPEFVAGIEGMDIEQVGTLTIVPANFPSDRGIKRELDPLTINLNKKD